MRTTIRACRRGWMLGAIMLLALLTPAQTALAKPKPLTKAEKERIDAAIKKGVDYLRRTQGKNGTWKQDHIKSNKEFLTDAGASNRLGYDFLAGLALLECGVPASDPGVQIIAGIVRKRERSLNATHTLSVAILFLDRLGEAKDEALLQSLSVRLLAAQCRDGAWGYTCPSISKRNEKAILETLRKLWPLTRSKDARTPTPPSTGGATPSSRESVAPARHPSRSGSSPKDAVPAGSGSPRSDAAGLIPPHLKMLTVFRSVRDSKEPMPARPTYLDVADTENIATHFALMALWTARRHGVPIDQTLRLLSDYFQRSQREDGNWPYRYRNGVNPQLITNDSRDMICIGLLGLATGQALQPGAREGRREVRDPRILKSFARLDREIGRPTGDVRRPPADPGTYFLWMVQQTAMVYGLETINSKDWYRWGAESLVNIQSPEGHWHVRTRTDSKWGASRYGKSTTTALALLFLKRYDPYRPLADRIRLDPKLLSK